MTASIREDIKQAAKLGGGTIHYWIRGTTDYIEARDLLLATTPATFNSAPLSNYKLDSEPNAWNIWTASADYSIPSIAPPHEAAGNAFISHDTSGGTVHISQSLNTIASYCVPCLGLKPNQYQWNGVAWTSIGGGVALPAECTEVAPPVHVPAPTIGDKAYATVAIRDPLPPGTTLPTAPDMHGAINVTKDGIEGCDIPSSEKKFTLTLYLDSLTRAQMERLDDACQCSNLNPISGWPCPNYAAGEVRFESWAANNQGRQNIEVRLNFVREPNRTDLQVGEMTGIAKRGQEYLWVYYKEFEDPTTKTVIKRPVYCYVEQVLFEDDFSIINELVALTAYTDPDAPT